MVLSKVQPPLVLLMFSFAGSAAWHFVAYRRKSVRISAYTLVCVLPDLEMAAPNYQTVSPMCRAAKSGAQDREPKREIFSPLSGRRAFEQLQGSPHKWRQLDITTGPLVSFTLLSTSAHDLRCHTSIAFIDTTIAFASVQTPPHFSPL